MLTGLAGDIIQALSRGASSPESLESLAMSMTPDLDTARSELSAVLAELARAELIERH